MAAQIIAVWSPKGGVGTTLLSAGLAMALARRHRTLLVDLAGGKADIAPLLGSPLHPSVLDYAASGQSCTHPSGVMILPGPARLVDGIHVNRDLARSVLERAGTEADVVVLDLGNALCDAALVGLERAERALLVSTPDLLSLYACRRFTQEAELIDLPLSRFRLVLNQAGRTGGAQEAQELVPLPLAATIPYMPGMAEAINRGMTSSLMRSGGPFAEGMAKLATSLGLSAMVDRAPLKRVMSPLPEPEGLLSLIKRWWQRL